MKRLVALLSGCAALAASLSLLFVSPVQAAQAIPAMTRSEIVARAESALGLTYPWGSESWVPDAGSGSGTDCSGLVLKCWQVPRTMLYQEEDATNAVISPRYTTYEFYNCLGPWSPLSSRALLKEGDILVYHSGGSGHVVIYAAGDVWNSPIIYEAPGTGQKLRRASRYLNSSYLPRRRASLTEGSTIILDNSTAKSVGGTDVGGNWTRSTATSGYYGSDFQLRASTTSAAWARWTPRIPTAGYYNVYMRWAASSNRATAARVTVCGAYGMFATSVNERYNGGTWNLIGRYYFTAGYRTGAGSIAIYATGANGYVCCDAVKFVPAP
jgi:hypothetical protein